MKRPKVYIKLSDLSRKPCSDYDYLPKNKAFDAIKEIGKGGDNSKDFIWLIGNCMGAQKKKVLKYFLSKDPSTSDLTSLMIYSMYAQKKKVLKLFLAKDPSISDLTSLMRDCFYARKKKVLKSFLAKKPDIDSLRRLIRHCPWAKEKINELN